MTAHELYKRHAPALGIDSYDTFVKVCELLDMPARISIYGDKQDGRKRWSKRSEGTRGSVGRLLVHAYSTSDTLPGPGQNALKPLVQRVRRLRIILLNGTVIREWPIDEYDGIF